MEWWLWVALAPFIIIISVMGVLIVVLWFYSVAAIIVGLCTIFGIDSK